ncbi:unnamed protein product [Sphagnum jensenii]|uniref:Uncharacterized protein n=1 Tax=Sphagnum jensenii TaxID=128206 RepID=A0ABP0XDT3_9BRYO
MAGTGGGGSGSRGSDNNEERLRKMVVDHLRASELFAIDTRTPEGLASLTAIFGQALQAGLTVGEAQREEEARKAAEAKATEKKRKRRSPRLRNYPKVAIRKALHFRCDQFRIAAYDAGYIASPEFSKDLTLQRNKVFAQAFWGSKLEYHGEFELIFGIAREL